MPSVESIPTAAMAMPYRPASSCAPMTAAAMTMSGITVLRIPVANPLMMMVAGPVTDRAAMPLVGLYS